ncbi:hypothetical protein KHQ82_05220 [Mycoplasmatota bacterium]|nr:hypothetical protein KHQ82_05220 [Mycoplasmatota bacterium]
MKRNYKDQFESKRARKLREREEFEKYSKKTEFEKGDFLALVIAALTTFFPIALGIFLLVFLIMMLIF